MLHLSTSTYPPVHPDPSLDGGGLVQARLLDRVPPPHVALHPVHWAHSVHPPSTGDKRNEDIQSFCLTKQIFCRFLHYEGSFMPSIPSFLPGHACLLHCWDSSEFPLQLFPPCAGVGLVQDLVLFCVPPLHDFVQVDHSLQSLQPPCTGPMQRKFCMKPAFIN